MAYRAGEARRRSGTVARRHLRGVAVLVGLYLLAIGFLLGTINERILFDGRRDAVLRPYEEALTQWRASRMATPAHARDLTAISTSRDGSDTGALAQARRGSWEGRGSWEE
jgi:hypothetical protein